MMNRNDYYRPPQKAGRGPVKPAPEREKLLPGGPITNLKLRKLSTLEKPFSLCILPQLYGLFMEVVKSVYVHAWGATARMWKSDSTLWSCFSPAIFMWVLAIEHGPPESP